ncbi:MAG: SH3 domain-containing protein [Devosia sp.]|nr:SH3 domain-containing protein [Devosia sp.]
MTTKRLLLAVAVGVLALFGLNGTALAATARASGAITIYAGPGYWYRPIGRLEKNEVVRLSECTPHGIWCKVVHDGPDGWVLGSYLIGSAAKVEATPWQPLVSPHLFGPPLRHPKF